MTGSLADYDSDRDQYVRAEQPWVCGRACDGQPCYIGPDDKGRCQVHLECVPVRREGRWHCTRPKAAGGKCADGPLPDGTCPHCPPPCQPKRGLLARRRVLTVFAASAALGGLLLLAGGGSDKALLSPGKLSVHHHALQQKCTNCHTAEEGHAVLKSVGASNAVDQSFKCIDCHRFGAHAKPPDQMDVLLRPHGVSSEQLAAVTRRIDESEFQAHPPAWLTLVNWGPGIPKDESGRLACAVCHQEHRGERHDLKRISERRCQICHAKPFHSFSKDHPEFTNYPYRRRTRIHFDHSAHYARHFAVFQRLMPEGRKPDSCTTCHQPDASGATMLTRGFEQSCASCHGREIQIENALPGVPLIQLPALDERAASWKDPAIGPWPRTVAAGSLPDDEATIDRLPPFLALLLSSDVEFREAQRVLRGVNLSALQNASADRKRAVRKYVSAIRRLFRELDKDGERALQKRIEAATETPLDRAARDAVGSPRSTGALLIDAMRAAGRVWFPPPPAKGAPPKKAKDNKEQQRSAQVSRPRRNVEKRSAQVSRPRRNVRPQVSRIGAGLQLRGDLRSNGVRGRETRAQRFGNWTVDFDDVAIRYRPQQHADQFLRFWLATSARHAARRAAPTTRERTLTRLFAQLADPAVPGSCVKCHTIDRQPDGTLRVNWLGRRPEPYTHRFTQFAHRPHLKELGTSDKACSRCHVRTGDVNLLHPQFTRRNGLPNFDGKSALTSGFHAVQRADCAKCHTANVAGQSCLQCHNYHVGRFPPRR